MRLFSSLLLVCLLGTSLARANDAVLILDASKSMWGRVEGKTKVDIARNVVSELLQELPADRRLGFVAYGHRRASDCQDIEQIAPVGTDRSAIRTALGTLDFKGKTPLTAAVRFAAEQLHYTESKATVILVSDGIESCHEDPCAAAAALEKAGIDLTVHVVGFGLKRSEIKRLKCVADATGGKYVSANNAAELAAALQQTVVSPSTIATVHGPESIAAGADFEVSWTGPGDTNDTISLTPAGSRVSCSIFGCSFPARGSSGQGKMIAPAKPGRYELHYNLLNEEAVASQALVVVATQATLNGPKSVPAGSNFEVQWTGPNNSHDFVSLARPEKYDAHNESRVDASGSKGAGRLHAPSEVGTYELRYVLRDDVKIATAPIVVTDVSATFKAPQSVGASQFFEFSWTGPNNDTDLLLLSAVGSRDDMSVDSRSPSAGIGKLRAPAKPGEYELRYYLDRQRVIGRQAITVNP